MIKLIAFFGPALLSLCIHHGRKQDHRYNKIETLIDYGLYVMLNVVLTEAVIAFLFGATAAVTDNLEIYGYFVKYMIIACLVAVLAPFMCEVIAKYIKIKCKIEKE